MKSSRTPTGGDLYFGGAAAEDGTTSALAPSRASQDTLTVGVTRWL